MRTPSEGEMNNAVVTVKPAEKSHGRYRVNRAHSEGIWVSPQLITGRTDEQTPVAKKTGIIRDLATPSVLQVAGLVARLVIQYPKETPAKIKSRILDSCKIQSWKGASDHYILDFPLQEIGSFQRMSPSPPRTSALSLPPVRTSNIRPLSRALRLALLFNTNNSSTTGLDVLPGTANRRGLKRLRDDDDNTHGDGR
ncbi:hypothetical protein H0H93_008790 [Arthromyces matolae]|nr:hypothetical protein H0H93_008790 [Arthromyces matolae]